MPQSPAYDNLIKPLARLIERFLDGKWDYSEFKQEFQVALNSYEESINDRAYWPLGAIADIPSHCKSDLHDYCRKALNRLPKEALDRSTRLWVESELICDDDGFTCFSFTNSDGLSRFESHAVLYSTCIDQYSFLLSSLNGTIKRPPFRYSELLRGLRDVGDEELATWVYGVEPDNAIAVIERIWSLGDVYDEPDQLRQIERQPAPEGGSSYLMLLPKSKNWMLLNEYDYERFSISLHGGRPFVEEVARRVNAEPDWGCRPKT